MATLEANTNHQVSELEGHGALCKAELERLATGSDALRQAMYKFENQSFRAAPSGPPLGPPTMQVPQPRAKVQQLPESWQEQLNSLETLRQTVKVNTSTTA